MLNRLRLPAPLFARISIASLTLRVGCVAVAALTVLLCARCGRQERQAVATPIAPKTAGTLLSVPHATIVAVTDWQATLKPCGCTVESQNGGVERIARWLGALRANDDSVMVVHAGSLLHDAEGLSLPGKAAQLAVRRQAFGQVLSQLGVAAVALSRWDLAQGGEAAAKAYAQAGYLALALTPHAAVPAAKASTLLRTASGVAVGLIGVDATDGQDDAARHAAVAAAVVGLRSQGADVTVALCNQGLRAARRLARAVPDLDVAVVGGLDERVEALHDVESEGDTLIVHAARHGAVVTALTLVPAGLKKGPWRPAGEFLAGAATELQARRQALAEHLDTARARATVATQRALPYYEAQLADLDRRIALAGTAAGKPLPHGRLAAFRAVALPWSAPTDPAMAAVVSAYDKAVAELADRDAAPPPPVEAGKPSYVGQTVCLACHAATATFAAKDAHAVAWKTLQDAGKTRDLDCVPCHVTGFGQPGGTTLGHLGQLTSVQCEACHGPGSLHAAKPAKGAKSLLAPVADSTCTVCHTPQHAPRFAFDPYRAKLLVPGHGKPLVGP